MDIKRNILILGLAVVSYFMLLAWNEDYPAQTTQVQHTPSANSGDVVNLSTDISAAASNTVGDLPSVETNTAKEGNSSPNSDAPAVEFITIKSPVQEVRISLVGGDIIRLALPAFPTAIETKDDPFVLLDSNPASLYIAQSGLIGTDGPDGKSTGRPTYRSEQNEYNFSEGTLEVDLKLPTVNGVDIIKRYHFSANDYLITIQYLVDNKGSTTWKGNPFGQIKRNDAADPSAAGGFGIRTYLGAVMTSPDDPYVKIKFDDIDDGSEKVTMEGGWIGFSQHYFLGSWVPEATVENTFTTRKNSAGDYLIGYTGPETIVAPGNTAMIQTSFWAGPKDQYRLKEISDDLGLTIDYGMLWFVGSPIFWLLTQINDLVGNYGLAIILLVCVVRLLFYPLSAKQFRSQANMKRLQPKVAQLKEKYGEDKQKFMQAQLELWKKESVNPFSGCLPPLLQMPVFLGIYWVLNESVELRQAPFMLWYHDLSAMDPYFILPLMLGAAYFLQQHLTPMMTTDPTQAKIMKFMPVMFTGFFLWFPSGLVLYYLMNAVLGILQQWYFLRKVEKAHSAPAES